jgi:hypothetical protein
MTVYVVRNGVTVDKETGEPMALDPVWKPVTPYTRGDYEAFKSPVTGQMIEGKRAREEDMKRHNCVDGRDYKNKTTEFTNPHFMAKRGINPDGTKRNNR